MERPTRQKERDDETERESPEQEDVQTCPECDSSTLIKSDLANSSLQ